MLVSVFGPILYVTYLLTTYLLKTAAWVRSYPRHFNFTNNGMIYACKYSLGDWNDIFIAHVIIIFKSEVSTIPIIIFLRGCVPRCLLHHILSLIASRHSRKTGILFSSLLCSLWWVQIVGYVLVCRLYSCVCTLHLLIIIIVQTCLKTLNL